MSQQAIHVVVQSDDGVSLFWDAKGSMSVAYNDRELGQWAVGSLRDIEIPRVDAKSPSSLIRQIAAFVPSEDQGDGQEATAIQLVILLGRDDEENPSVVVWSPLGKTLHARGFEAVGKVLRELAEDPRQPRVMGGAPPDLFGEVVSRGLPMLGRLLFGGS